ncbi:MAG TPA: hypothetical protein VF688_11075 [Allosphingosinicella sp.]
MKAALIGLVLISGLGSAASASPADHIAPRDLHRFQAQFDGKRTGTGGDLLSVSDRCVSFEHERGGGMFVVSKSDADRIRKLYRESGRGRVLIEGIFRSKLVQPSWATPSPCGEAGFEDVTVRPMGQGTHPKAPGVRINLLRR